MPYCPNCGEKIGKTFIFCTKCGFNIKEAEEAEKAQSEVSTPEGKCAYHPERDAVGTCVDCGKEICFFCRTVLKNNNYCPACIDKLPSQPTERIYVASQDKSITEKPTATTISWWKRHLCWTLFLGNVLTCVIGFIILLFYSLIHNVALDHFSKTTAGNVAFAFFMISFIGLLIFNIRLRIWYLRSKSRSLWFLILNLLWLLVLENRSADLDKA